MNKRARKTSSKRTAGRESISSKIDDASDAVGSLVRSIAMTIEERIALEDHIKNMSRDSESMLDRIEDVKRDKQRKVLVAYRKFLEQNLTAVDEKLKKIG